MGLNCLTIVLFAGLIFGVTYFSTIAMKHARGIMLGAGIILGYLILRALVQHYWSVDLPSLLLQAFDLSPLSHNSWDFRISWVWQWRYAVLSCYSFLSRRKCCWSVRRYSSYIGNSLCAQTSRPMERMRSKALVVCTMPRESL